MTSLPQIGLRAGFVAVALGLWFRERAPEPPPAVAQRVAAPIARVPDPVPAPVATVEAPEPPTDPAPVPRPEVRPPKPMDEPAITLPPPAPPPEPARFEVTGDATSAWLVSGDNRYPAGEVPAGYYRIEASFGGGDPTPAGSVALAAGEAKVLHCDGGFMKCE